MRIISGRLKGRIIPDNKNFGYRPSTGRFKEAVFSILESKKFIDLQESYVLDLFSGTASFAFESLSRGAKFITAIDRERDLIKISKIFAEKIGESTNTAFLVADATDLPKASVTYDLVFIDPPYFKSLADKALKSLHHKKWLKYNAIILIELSRKEDITIPDYYTTLDERKYGNSKLIILTYNDAQ